MAWMPWIDTVSPANAAGRLRRIYDAAVKRAGKVFNIISIQSQQPEVLQSSLQLYQRVMLAPGEPLTRAQREMLAVTVSRTNACGY